jgi:hypothetical protein
LATAISTGQAAQAVVDLRHAVSNDHRGSLYPAAVPAAAVFLQVIAEWPGEPRGYALNALLDWWGCFLPEPGFESYDHPVLGPVEVTEGIMWKVRDAVPLLHRAVENRSIWHHRAIEELLSRLDKGWVVDDL